MKEGAEKPGMKHSEKISLSEEGLRGPISTRELAAMWRSRHGIETSRFFPEAEMRLERVAPWGYYRFHPALPGDAEFYGTLMRKMGYDAAEKAEFLEAAKEIGSGDRVLDVGCGVGNFSRNCSGTYYGLETNPSAVEDAGRLGRNVRLGFVEDEPPGTCDVVTVFQVLEHVTDPKGFLTACARCLRPGGRLIVSTPNMRGLMGYLTNEILNYPPHHMSWWSEASLRALIADCGCETLRGWQEPLQAGHLRSAICTLLAPRGAKHLDSSLRYRCADFAARVFARAARKNWEDVPFITGHTVMVVAEKQQ
ncbi:MAG: class I SAM-dependent methyltransferase [Acidobacteriaceae bacterium]